MTSPSKCGATTQKSEDNRAMEMTDSTDGATRDANEEEDDEDVCCLNQETVIPTTRREGQKRSQSYLSV